MIRPPARAATVRRGPAERTLPSRLPAADELHLWRASLAPGGARVAELARTLSDDERARAERFVAPDDRRRFVAARAALRELLGRYLERPPSSVAFAYGPAGKPELDGDSNGPDLRFSLAHSGEVALYAVTIGRRVGVDVEALRPIAELRELSRLVFSDREREELWAQPAWRRERTFFDGWVRKEAVLKALGHGLSAGLESTEVSLARDGGRLLRAVDGDARACADWTLLEVPMGPRHAAAVASEGGHLRIVTQYYTAASLDGFVATEDASA